jgi:ADP-heptose:LPS heptosyltransferase
MKCYILGSPMSTKRLNASKVNSIRRTCVIFPGALGDFICFLPALQALAHTVAVDLFARSEFAEIAPKGVIVGAIDRPEITRLFRPESIADNELQKFFDNYDAVYSWFASRDENFVLRLLALTDGGARVFPFRAVSNQAHQTDHYLGCLNAPAGTPREPVIQLRAEAVAWADSFWSQHALRRRPVMVIAPGSGAREKNWPSEFFLAVIHWWKEAIDGMVLLLSGPVEQDRGGIEPLQSSCIVAGDLNLSRVAALLARSDLFLGNDSGVSHLCAALGVRTAVVFGPSDPVQWAPRGRRVTVLRRGIECSPCHELIMKRCPHRACLSELHPAQIIATLEELPEVVTLTRQKAGITV